MQTEGQLQEKCTEIKETSNHRAQVANPFGHLLSEKLADKIGLLEWREEIKECERFFLLPT